jgi:SCY1-like protein 2
LYLPGLLWKVYRGTKKTTKQEASIYVFEKKQLDRHSKDDREQLYEILKKSVVQLTKLRHPHILTVQHPLEESRDSIAFATEPCFASLANVLGNVRNPTTISNIGLILIKSILDFQHASTQQSKFS